MVNIKNISVLLKRGISLAKQPVVKNIILVVGITFAVKGLGFLKESIIASEFGLSLQLDTFFIAMLIPGFINTVFLGSFKNVFIPNYIGELKTGNDIGPFQATGFLMVLGLSLIFLFFAYLITDLYLQTFFAGQTEEYYHLIKIQFYFLAPCIVLWGFSTLLSGLLNINNEFKYSSLNTIFIPIAIIICVLFYRQALGELTLATGTLIGSFLNLLFILFIATRKKIIKLSKPDFQNKNALLMLKQVPAKASSGFFTGLIGVTDQYFAAQLALGSIAALNYGIKIPAFITGLLILAMSNVLLPHFSVKVLDNREKAFTDLYKILKWLFISSAIVAIIAIFLSDFVVQLLFERNEFTSEDTYTVANIQKIILIYAPFTICGMVLVNFLTSINKNVFMAQLAFGSMLLNILLDFIFMKYYGIYGIALCTTVIYIIRSVILLRYTVKQKNLGE